MTKETTRDDLSMLLDEATALASAWKFNEALALLGCAEPKTLERLDDATHIKYLVLRLRCAFNIGHVTDVEPLLEWLRALVESCDDAQAALDGAFHLALMAPDDAEREELEATAEDFEKRVSKTAFSTEAAHATRLVQSATLYDRLGETDRSLRLLRRAYDLPGAAGNLVLLNNLINLEVRTGALDDAGRHYAEAEARFEEMQDAGEEPSRVALAHARIFQGRIALMTGDYADAEAHLSAALELARSQDDRLIVQLALMLLVFVSAALGQRRTARNYVNVCLGMAHKRAERRRVLALRAISTVLFADEPTGAEEALREGRALSDGGLVSLALYALGAVALRSGRREAATRRVAAAVEHAEKRGYLGFLCEACHAHPAPLHLCPAPLPFPLSRVGAGERYPVRVTTLGDARVRFGDESADVGAFYSTKYFHLLVWLAQRRREAPSKAAAAEAVWPERGARASYGNLVNGIARIRRALRGIGAPLPRTRPKGVVSLGYPLRTDLDEMAEVAKSARAVALVDDASSLYERVLEFYRGPFLEGAPYVWAEDARWAAFNVFQEAALYLARKRAERGEHAEALSLAERVIEEDPLAEEAYDFAAERLLVMGRTDEARRLRERLKRQLAGLER